MSPDIKSCSCLSERRINAPRSERVSLFAPDFIPPAPIWAKQCEEAVYRSIAFHEAGHVVAATAFGRPINYVTIALDAPHISYGEDGDRVITLESEIVTAIAGH